MKSALAGAIALLLAVAPAHASPIDKHWKTTRPQKVSSSWNDLVFDQGSRMPARKNARALYSVQVRMSCKTGVKPRYLKIRLARHTPQGLDTTATNTYVWTSKGPGVFYASLLWQIEANHPVSAQIRVIGGTCRTVTTRQFKMLTLN